VDERAERAAVHGEPGDECAELGGGEEVDFEHWEEVRADGGVAGGVDAEFGDYVVEEEFKLAYII